MYRLKQLMLMAGDLLCLFAGLYLGVAARYLHLPNGQISLLAGPMALLFLLAIIILFIAGAYDVSRTKTSWPFFQKIIISSLIWVGLGVAYFYLKPKNGASPKTILALAALFGFGLIALWRHLYNRYLSASILKSNVIFAGLTDEVKELINLFKNEPQTGYRVIGIFENNFGRDNYEGILVFKNIGELNAAASGADIIVLSPQLEVNKDLLKELYKGLFNQISVVQLSDFYETIMGRIPPFTFSEGWFVAHLNEQRKKIYDRFKIFADYGIALGIAVFFAVTFPFIALAIKLNSKGSVFFRQNRVGRQGKIFKVYKYRTMVSLAPDGSAETSGPQYAQQGDARITPVGKFLRASRLDEVPQFINILRGEMSLIGPRPERPEFVAQLTEQMPYYTLRHLVKPGLTGWAQVHKAYYGTIEENLRKLEYDLFYIKNRDLVLDISIILKTINTLFRMIGR